MVSHYLGSTKKARGDRFKEYQSQVGARITKVAVERGRSLVSVRTWDGGWNWKRELQKLYNNRWLCPICRRQETRNAAWGVALDLRLPEPNPMELRKFAHSQILNPFFHIAIASFWVFER